GKNLMFLFLVSEKGTEKADLGAAAPKYPAASRANADAQRRLIRTRLPEGGNLAFAASKRTAKSEKRSRIGFAVLPDLFGGNLLRFKPRKRGYGVCGFLRGQGPSQAPKFLAPASPILLGWSFRGDGFRGKILLHRTYGVGAPYRSLMFVSQDGPPRTSVPTKFVVFP
ncbi:MAG: hypothetical protein IJW97_06160, partial [Clostridia bacterium]|nr:hypothetical protein [Clostridia bacterium]